MMLNIVLGAGLLTLPGLAAEAAGPSALIVWLVCAAAAAPLLVVFAILGRNFPDAGGLAAFLKRGFGQTGYTLATFLFLGAVSVGLPAIALTGGHYAAAALGGPPALYAAALVIGAMLANLASAETAGRLNAALASIIVLILGAIAVAGWVAVQPGWDTLASSAEEPLGIGVFGATFMMVFFAFTGWEVSANLGGEFKNPRRDFPIAMGFSFAVAVALYLGLAVIAVGAGDAGSGPAPFAAIFARDFGPAGGQVIALVSVLLIFANLSAAIWAVSRMVYSAATEGLLPKPVATLKDGVPMRAVAAVTATLVTVVALAGIEFVELAGLLGAAGLNFLLLYGGAAAALIRLSRTGGPRLLGWFCVALVAILIAASGVEALYYPGALILCALLVASCRASRGTIPDLRQSSS